MIDVYDPAVAGRRVRRTQIDDVDYAWVVAPHDANHLVVRVWLQAPDRRRRRQLHVMVPRFFLPGRAGESVRPKVGRGNHSVTQSDLLDCVRSGIAAGWRPESIGAPMLITM